MSTAQSQGKRNPIASFSGSRATVVPSCAGALDLRSHLVAAQRDPHVMQPPPTRQSPSLVAAESARPGNPEPNSSARRHARPSRLAGGAGAPARRQQVLVMLHHRSPRSERAFGLQQHRERHGRRAASGCPLLLIPGSDPFCHHSPPAPVHSDSPPHPPGAAILEQMRIRA